MLFRPAVFSLLFAAVACGGSADLSSSSTDPQKNQDPSASGTPQQNGDENKPPSGMPATLPTHEVTVTLHNMTKGEVRVVKDYQAPLWLEIGTPAYQLNGYGQSWCGHKEMGHNEPFFFEQKVAAGDAVTVKWNASEVTYDENGSCWQYEKLPVGSLSARACIYEGTDHPGKLALTTGGNPFPAGPGDKGAPSTWFEKAPTRCVPLTIEIKDGGSSVDVVIAPP